MKRWTLVLAAILGSAQALVSTQAFANDPIILGTPATGGTGCPAGAASVTVAPDGSAISLLFDNFVAQAGGTVRMARKVCSISVPVHVPQGFQVAILQIDYRGFNSVPNGGLNQFNAEYFWAGAVGPKYTKNFFFDPANPTGADYLVTNKLAVSSLVWTPCGADINLRTNASIMSRSNFRGEQAMMTVDSADITAGIIYQLQWRSCN